MRAGLGKPLAAVGVVLLALGLYSICLLIPWGLYQGGFHLFGSDITPVVIALFGPPGASIAAAGILAIIAGACGIFPWWTAGMLAPASIIMGGSFAVALVMPNGLESFVRNPPWGLIPIGIVACEAFSPYAAAKTTRSAGFAAESDHRALRG